MEDSFLQLKQVREGLGLTLNEIAQKLSIKRNYLESIEAGQWNELPEDVYTIGFIRNYARFLKVESDDIVEQFKASRVVTSDVDKNTTLPLDDMKFVFDKQIQHWLILAKDDKKLRYWAIGGGILFVCIIGLLLL